MDEIERYLFDTQGYLVVRGVLAGDEVRRLVAAIPRDAQGRVRDRRSPDDGRILAYPEPLFRRLVAHPAIVPRLEAIMGRGDAPNGRPQRVFLSHEYVLSLVAGEHGPPFHNGGTPHDPWCSYAVHDGAIACGLVGVLWTLTDAKDGDGGFWCIPGSHKAAFALPRAIQHYERVPECVVQPSLTAGDVVLFSEALTHGTRPWRAAHERLALFYKYEPWYLQYPTQYARPAACLADLTADERRFIRPARLQDAIA